MTKTQENKETLIQDFEERFFDGHALEDNLVERLKGMTETQLLLVFSLVEKALSKQREDLQETGGDGLAESQAKLTDTWQSTKEQQLPSWAAEALALGWTPPKAKPKAKPKA